jgi:hypothetical protein
MEKLFHPVHRMKFKDCRIHFEVELGQPWERHRPRVKVSGEESLVLSDGELSGEGVELTIQIPAERNFDLALEGGSVFGIHPGGSIEAKESELRLKPRPPRKSSLLSGLSRDLGAIAGLTALMVLALSPLLSPPRYLDYMVVAAASIYLGLNGSARRVLLSSLIIGVAALIAPSLYRGEVALEGEFQGNVAYAIKIILYLVLWGGGKKLKDWYRGSVS